MNDAILAFEVEATGIVEDIKVLVCAEWNIPVEEQVLLHNRRILTDDFAKIRDVGIENNAFILLSTRSAI